MLEHFQSKKLHLPKSNEEIIWTLAVGRSQLALICDFTRSKDLDMKFPLDR